MNLTAMVRHHTARTRISAVQTAQWLQQHMSPYFFQAMSDEPEALILLAKELPFLQQNHRLMLADRDTRLIMACVNRPGSLYDTLKQIDSSRLSYALFAHSRAPLPGLTENLEVQRFEFERRHREDIDLRQPAAFPPALLKAVRRELRASFPAFRLNKLEHLLNILWLNNKNHLRISPPSRVAWLVWLLAQGNASGGLFLDMSTVMREGASELRVLFAVGNPPQTDFLLQVLEVFNRLDIGICRAYCHTIFNGIHPYFLGGFFVTSRQGKPLTPDSNLAEQLRKELCTTQILCDRSPLYRQFVVTGLLSGEDATLINAFTFFCHTNLAHNQPERYSRDDIISSFHDHPEMAQLCIRLFRARFDPALDMRDQIYQPLLEEVKQAVNDYNTGHRWLDELRRSIYQCCLLFITHTLKTNFFIVEKQALAFRLDPAYLRLLDSSCTADLPQELPFRITFFFSRFGAGYHIGFSDIARGGWRTIIARNADDVTTSANTLFREVYVLAHTQHLKNKDIYEGGSKMALVLDASDLRQPFSEEETCRLYKLHYCVTHAFLDIFVTEQGRAKDRRVVDYYGDDEAIEIGPDENMHDAMIEEIARLSKLRGYILGIGIISSKRVGINHKEYGVTSTGVITFAQITMAEVMGISMKRDAFSLKMTGGPSGDVAGNCLRILLHECPQVSIRLILDGTAALVDPLGINHRELKRLVLHYDLDQFDPAMLNEGATIIFKTGTRRDGLRDKFRKVTRQNGTLNETWLDVDEFHHLYNNLVFTTPADLFIPAGGRPETIDSHNWQQFFDGPGNPSARVIIEGANSFITPEARLLMQKKGVVIIRDSSANKCGVISSSYEIIANLLLSEQEFLHHKETYISGVLSILRQRASDEAHLILHRYREPGNTSTYTELSEMISHTINGLYRRLFELFSKRPELCLQQPFRKALLNHLPHLIRTTPVFRNRIQTLPPKYQAAILAAEIGSSLVYSGNRDADFEEMVRRHLARVQR